MLYLVDIADSGGAERIIIRLSRGLSSISHSFFTTAVKSPGLSRFDLSGVRVFEVEGETGRGLIGKALELSKSIVRLRKLVIENEIDVIVSFLERSNVTAYVVGKLTGTRVVVSVRNNIYDQYKDSKLRLLLSKLLLRHVYQRVDVLTSLSQGISSQLTDYLNLNRDIVTLPNPYDINSFIKSSEIDIDSSINLGKYKYFSACGRLSNQKGFDHILKIFKFYIFRGGKCDLVILGEGEQRQYLEGLIADFGLEGKVHLLGFRSDAPSIIANSNAFLFPSRWEGFGNAALETLAYGTPLISADCKYGPREILNISYDEVELPIVNSYGILCQALSFEFDKNGSLDNSQEQFLESMLTFDRTNFMKNSMQKRAFDFDEECVLPLWSKEILDYENKS